jgi:hypothetical protein
MVTTSRPARPMWGTTPTAPWASPEAYDQYRGLAADLRAQAAVPDPDASESDPAPQRTSARAAAQAILDATGARVDLSVRPERSEEVSSTPDDAYGDAEPLQPDQFTQAAIRELAAIRTSEAEQAAAERRERRNARDRARRLKAYKTRVRRGVTTHGPKPRGR